MISDALSIIKKKKKVPVRFSVLLCIQLMFYKEQIEIISFHSHGLERETDFRQERKAGAGF